jgi:hypothetical protein
MILIRGKNKLLGAAGGIDGNKSFAGRSLSHIWIVVNRISNPLMF